MNFSTRLFALFLTCLVPLAAWPESKAGIHIVYVQDQNDSTNVAALKRFINYELHLGKDSGFGQSLNRSDEIKDFWGLMQTQKSCRQTKEGSFYAVDSEDIEDLLLKVNQRDYEGEETNHAEIWSELDEKDWDEWEPEQWDEDYQNTETGVLFLINPDHETLHFYLGSDNNPLALTASAPKCISPNREIDSSSDFGACSYDPLNICTELEKKCEDVTDDKKKECLYNAWNLVRSPELRVTILAFIARNLEPLRKSGTDTEKKKFWAKFEFLVKFMLENFELNESLSSNSECKAAIDTLVEGLECTQR